MPVRAGAEVESVTRTLDCTSTADDRPANQKMKESFHAFLIARPCVLLNEIQFLSMRILDQGSPEAF